MEEEGEEDAVRGGHHVAKRARKNKSVVAVFDDAARTEYLTGFRKRKNKRRKVAEAEKQVKERQKRLQLRKERRAAMKLAQGNQGECDADEVLNEGEEVEIDDNENLKVSGTTTYDDGDTTVIVTTCSLEPDDHTDYMQSHDRPPSTMLGKRPGIPLGTTLPKKAVSVNKKQRVVSQKRTKKLTRRERSVPKNQRAKKGGRRK